MHQVRPLQVFPQVVAKNDVDEYIKKNFLARTCNQFHSENTGICECGYSKKDHNEEAGKKTFPTNAFGRQTWRTGITNYNPDCGWYVRLDHETDVSKILGLFYLWDVRTPEVIFSVLSTDKSIETSSAKSDQNISTMICNSLVKAASSINAWIITGGLNEGVDKLIGEAVRQRLGNSHTIPKAVLGISNWGCLEETHRLLNATHGENGSPYSLNQYHTHSLLVDDGTLKKPGCQVIFREKLESVLMTRVTDHGMSGIPLIYVLIGGGIKEFDLVKRALARGSPIIVTLGTGGASEIIYAAITTKEGSELKQLTDIYAKPFNGLAELLTENNISPNEVEDAIDNLKAMKFQRFCKIVALLDKIQLPEGDSHIDRFEYGILKLKIPKYQDPLAKIIEHIKLMHAENMEEDYSAANAGFNTVNRMRVVIRKLLMCSNINKDKARQAVNDLNHDILTEMLLKLMNVSVDLKAIRNLNRKDGLLLKFNINNTGITSYIVEALTKVKLPRPIFVYTQAANWNLELSFTNLLRFNFEPTIHEVLFKKLLQRNDKNQYVQLMLEHMNDSSWLMKRYGLLEQDFKKAESSKLYEKWITRFRDANSITDYNAERLRGKMLFVWCIQKQMPKAAMRFWNQGQDCLAMLLVAYKELGTQKKALFNEIGRQQTKAQMQYFEKLALEFLTKCYANSRQNTQDLIIAKLEDIGNVTPLQIAAAAKLNAFLYAEPTERQVNKIWTNDIQFYNKNTMFMSIYMYLPMLLSFACPLVAPWLLTFGEPSDDSKIRLPRIFSLPEFEMHGIRMPADDRNDELQNDTTRGLKSYRSKLKCFMCCPLVIYFYWFTSRIGYITLFSIVLLTDFRAKISQTEIVLTILTSILVIDAMRQILTGHIFKYKQDGLWNYLDFLPLYPYIIGFIMRMIYHVDPTTCPDCLYYARIVMAFSLMYFFLLTLKFLSIYDNLGPKIFMMRQLILVDIIPFLAILGVFVTAYGVVSNVILYPNQPLNGKLLQDIIYDAWWSVIQQFNRDDGLGSNCNKNNVSSIITAEYCSNTSDDSIDYVQCKENKCPANSWIVPILLAIYTVLTCIMLLNVLIAMFNETFAGVVKEQKGISTMQRYRMILNYSSLGEKELTPKVKSWQYDMAEDFFNEHQAREEWPTPGHRTYSETSGSILDTIQDIPDNIREQHAVY